MSIIRVIWDYSTNTNSFGAGLGFRISPMIDLNLGGQYTMYAYRYERHSAIMYLGTYLCRLTETYTKSTWVVGIGLDFHFGAK